MMLPTNLVLLTFSTLESSLASLPLFLEGLLSKNLGSGNSLLQLSFGLQTEMDYISNSLSLFHDGILMGVIISILFLVGVIMVGSRTLPFISFSLATHTSMEFMWIIFPLLSLFGIGVPSIFLLYLQESAYPLFSSSIIITGFQWYWTYGKSGGEEVESYMDNDNNTLENLSSDNGLVVEGGTPLRLLITGGDVMHCWTLPSFFLKMDGVPGRLNQLSFAFPPIGGKVFYGQCSELCGANHSFMPISVEIL